MRINWHFFLIVFSALFLMFVFGKRKNTSTVGKFGKDDKGKCFFFKEKAFSSFKIASLPSWVGRNYAGDCRPFFINWFPKNMIILFLLFACSFNCSFPVNVFVVIFYTWKTFNFNFVHYNRPPGVLYFQRLNLKN